jgi:hypothetical protein
MTLASLPSRSGSYKPRRLDCAHTAAGGTMTRCRHCYAKHLLPYLRGSWIAILSLTLTGLIEKGWPPVAAFQQLLGQRVNAIPTPVRQRRGHRVQNATRNSSYTFTIVKHIMSR